MPNPLQEFDQVTGSKPADLPRVLLAFLNSVWDFPGNTLRAELVFEPVGPHSSGLAISSAVTLTPPAGATKIRLQTLTIAIRYTLDGSTPTASVGFQLAAAAAPIVIHMRPNTVLRVIQESATSSLQYQFGR